MVRFFYISNGDKMYCKICNKIERKERKFRDILKNRKFYICDSCFNKLFDFRNEVLPIKNHNILIYHLYKKEDIEYNYLFETTSLIFLKLLKLNQFILFDEFTLKNYVVLEKISEILNVKYTILSFY